MHTSNTLCAGHKPSQFATREELLALAKFCDEEAHAVSFYFSLSSSPDSSHREEEVSIKNLVRDTIGHCEQGTRTEGFLKDLAQVLAAVEDIRSSPSRFRAVFACRDQHIWQDFDLPALGSISHLGVGRHFDMAPLLAARESCTPYCVVLIERGKARAFVVRGTEVHELLGRLLAEDLGLHADDSRVGWSHHISGILEEHAKAYLKHFALQLHSFMAEQGCARLVVGCREDLWSDVEAQLLEAGRAALIGRFHLPGFDVSAAGVLLAARPVFEEDQRRRYLDAAGKIQEGSLQSVLGLNEVLRSLDEGRVHKLILGKTSDEVCSECKDCGRSQAGVCSSCPFCGSAELRPVVAREVLVRRSLLTDAEVLLPGDESYGLDDVAAWLRY